MKSKGSSEFWLKHGALHQISPEKALIIGDFGDGSDTAIILDFGSQMMDPPVLRLRWNPDRSTEWVKVANGIDEFSSMLGL